MAYCLIIENPEMSEDRAQQVFAHVRSSGPVPPEGCRLMLAGPAGVGTRVVSVWDSPEATQRFFAERLEPAYAEAGLSLDRIARTPFDVHTLVSGDLTGAPQPA
jgi:hypothetical protein